MTADLTVIDKVNGTALAPYHDRDEVRELANRLLALHPASSEVGKEGMTAIAQLALMIGASPLPGVNEIHVWKAGGKVQFQLGVNYFRRMANEEGGVLWQTKPRQMDERERKEYGINQGQLAAICSAVRIVDMEKWLRKGFEANQIFDMLAATGTAVAGANESKHGRPPIWTALKRAEVDVYKQLFPTMMAKVGQAQAEMPDVRVETDPGPEWDGMEGHDADFDLDAANDEIFGSNGNSNKPEPVEAEFEEVEAEPEEKEVEVDHDLEGIIADCRADLESKIVDGKLTLGEVYETAVATGLYNNWKHAYQAVVNPDSGYDLKGAKPHKSQVVTGKGGLMVFNWLMSRKETEPA